MEGKGFVVGIALIAVGLVVLFGVALANGSSDDPSGNDCVAQEYC